MNNLNTNPDPVEPNLDKNEKFVIKSLRDTVCSPEGQRIQN